MQHAGHIVCPARDDSSGSDGLQLQQGHWEAAGLKGGAEGAG